MIFTSERVSLAAQKKSFSGRIMIDESWDSLLKLLDQHPQKHLDYRPDKCRFYLKNAHKRPSTPYWSTTIVNEMKRVFHKNQITNIVFFNFGPNASSYPWHKDKMDVFLVQVKNKVRIRVENYWEEERDFTVGEYVYIPRGTHHEIKTNHSRVTFSFGVEQLPDPETYLDS